MLEAAGRLPSRARGQPWSLGPRRLQLPWLHLRQRATTRYVYVLPTVSPRLVLSFTSRIQIIRRSLSLPCCGPLYHPPICTSCKLIAYARSRPGRSTNIRHNSMQSQPVCQTGVKSTRASSRCMTCDISPQAQAPRADRSLTRYINFRRRCWGNASSCSTSRSAGCSRGTSKNPARQTRPGRRPRSLLPARISRHQPLARTRPGLRRKAFQIHKRPGLVLCPRVQRRARKRLGPLPPDWERRLRGQTLHKLRVQRSHTLWLRPCVQAWSPASHLFYHDRGLLLRRRGCIRPKRQTRAKERECKRLIL